MIDASLRACEHPWDGLADLRQHFLGFTYDRAIRSNAVVMEVIAPLGIVLNDDSRLEDDSLWASVYISPGVNRKQVSLSVVATLKDNTVFRVRTPLAEGDHESVSKLKLPAGVTKASLIVTCRGVDVDRLEFLASANPRLAVLEQLGVSPDSLQSQFEKALGRDFERWCVILFQLLGLSPAHYDETKIEAPDILAFSEFGGWILLIECTQREPDLGGKLTKLATRTKAINQGLKGLMKAHPVVITALPRSMLNRTDVEKASKRRDFPVDDG